MPFMGFDDDGRHFRALPLFARRLGQDLVVPSQRGRMLDAIAIVVAEKGYSATSVADVVRAAGVSRKTFYEHFADKRDCYLIAYQLATDVLIERITKAVMGVEDQGERIERMLSAYLEGLAEAPIAARAFLVEVQGADKAAQERRIAILDQFATAIPAPDDAPADETSLLLRTALVAGVEEIVTRHIRAGKATQLSQLKLPLLELAARILAPSALGVGLTLDSDRATPTAAVSSAT